MRRTIKIVPFLLLALQACTDDSPGLIVSHVVAWDSSCVARPESDLKNPTGLYDARCGSSYFLPLVVQSFTISRADSIRPRAEPNIVQLSRAEVTLTNLEGELIDSRLQPFSTTVEATIQPGTVSDPSTAIALVEVIPEGYASTVRKQAEGSKILAAIRLYGQTTGGTDVEVSEYVFPIEICDGCLAVYADSTAAGAGPCDFDSKTVDSFSMLEGCQNGWGYDGSICFCSSESEKKCDRCDTVFFE
jgi:hypothetical protein